MINDAWTNWLRSVTGHRGANLSRTQRRRPVRVASIEALEDRVLLTAPTVVNDFGVLDQDTDLASSIAGLGSDDDGDSLTYTMVTGPHRGGLSLSSDGTFLYTPLAGYTGADDFTFLANDGTEDSNVGTFHLSVVPVNEAPVVIDDFRQIGKNATLSGNVFQLSSDANEDVLTYAVVQMPQHGTLTFNTATGTYTYKPDTNFVGADLFTFQANDNVSDSNEGTVNLLVNQNHSPVVIDGAANPDEDLALSGSLVPLATDSDSDPLTFAVVNQPAHGTVALNANGTFTYTPAANYSGVDSFTFRANDGTGSSNVGTFNFTVSPVDDALALTFSTVTTKISRTSTAIRIDPSVSLADGDSTLNFANAKIRALISTGNTKGDYQKGRVGLQILSQGNGPGQVFVSNGNVYYNGSPTSIATVSGGTLGRSLVIQFRNNAEVTSAAVNAVLRQIAMVASKKATSLTASGLVGIRLVDVAVSAGGESVLATKTVSVV